MNQAGQMQLLRDAKGEVVRSRLDEETLRAIAQATGGSYYPFGPRGDGLSRVRAAFATLEDPLAGNRARRRGVERFHVPLALALLLLTTERLLSTRRRGVACPADSLPPTQSATAAALSLALALACPVIASGQTNQLAAPDVSLKPNADHADLIDAVDRMISRWPAAFTNTSTSTNPAVLAVTGSQAVTPRQKFNLGTRKLAEGQLTDAESLLQSVLQAQDERTRSAALYNLGHVRFAQGAKELEKGPSGKQTIERSQAAIEHGQQAIQQAQSALAEKELHKMVSAYLSGRGARREFREALKAVKQAMDSHGATLVKWRRSLGDFRSAAELNPADKNAAENARLTEQAIATLVDSLREMVQMAMAMSEMSQELKEMMQKLKGQIPMENMPPGAPGEEEEEEVMPESLRGRQEDKGKEGRELERPLSPEEAGRMLDGLQRGGDRRLPMSGREMGGDKEGKPDSRPKQPW